MWRPEAGQSGVRLAKNGPADGVGCLLSIVRHGRTAGREVRRGNTESARLTTSEQSNKWPSNFG